MRVTLTAYSILREKLPAVSNGKVKIDLPEGSTLADLLARFDLPPGTACSVNGTIQREVSLQLKESDQVAVFRPGAGG